MSAASLPWPVPFHFFSLSCGEPLYTAFLIRFRLQSMYHSHCEILPSYPCSHGSFCSLVHLTNIYWSLVKCRHQMLGASEQLVSKREQVPDVIKWLTEVIAKGYVIKFCDAELCVCVCGGYLYVCVFLCVCIFLCVSLLPAIGKVAWIERQEKAEIETVTMARWLSWQKHLLYKVGDLSLTLRTYMKVGKTQVHKAVLWFLHERYDIHSLHHILIYNNNFL